MHSALHPDMPGIWSHMLTISPWTVEDDPMGSVGMAHCCTSVPLTHMLE